MTRLAADKVDKARPLGKTKAGGKPRHVKPLARATTAPAPGLSHTDYWRESESPLTSLLFLLPLIVLYEFGAGWLSPGPRPPHDQQIIAFVMMRQFFALFGANARHLPALAIAGILIAWHVARKDPWKINLQTFLGMAVESIGLAVPLLMLGMVLPYYFPLAGVGHPAPGHAAHAAHAASSVVPVGPVGVAGLASAETSRTFDYVALFCGAGVYEELVFRLILLTFFSLILRDAFQMRPTTAAVLMVLASGVLFSAYHYLSPDEPPFRLSTFVFRSLAGIYFGILFLTRGFGITAASHSAYDIFVLMLTVHSG